MNEATAIEIAKKEGFGHDTLQWEITFFPYGMAKNNYRWSIKKYRAKSASNTHGAYYADGEDILIDAITGKTEHGGFIEME